MILNPFNNILISVIVCLFVSNTEPKYFCQAFRENGNKIDYTFDYIHREDSEKGFNTIFIIGGNYWILEINEESVKLVSNESLYCDVIKGDYSLAFTVRNPLDGPRYYGFLRVRQINRN